MDTRTAIPAEEGESCSRSSVLPCRGPGAAVGLWGQGAHWPPLVRHKPWPQRPGSLGEHGHPIETRESGTGLDIGDSSWLFPGFHCRANPREPPQCLLALSLCLAPLTLPGPCRVNVLQLGMSFLPSTVHSQHRHRTQALPGWKRLTGNEDRKAGMCQTPGKH